MFPNSKNILKKVGNTTNPKKPLWDEYVDSEGNSTLEEHIPKEVWRSCEHGKCYFVSCDTLGNVQCRYCGRGQKIIWGLHKIEKGQIIQLHKE